MNKVNSQKLFQLLDQKPLSYQSQATIGMESIFKTFGERDTQMRTMLHENLIEFE